MDDYHASTKTFLQKYGRALKVLIPFRYYKKRNKEVLQSTKVGLFSYITLVWLDKIMWRASRKGVQKDELKRMEDVDEVEKNSKRFIQYWKKELKTHGTENASLVRVIWRFCRVRVILSAIMMCLICVFQYIGPAWILKYFLDFISDETQPMSNGIILVVLFSASQLLRGVTISVYLTIGGHTAIRAQGAVQMLIYEKILSINQDNGKLISEAISFFSTDTERINIMLYQCMFIIGVPFIGVLNIIYCYLIMGPWSLLANGIILFYYLSMALVAGKISELRVKLAAVADERVSLTTQIISNIKLIKMYVWEKNLTTRIKDIRRSEVSLQMKSSLLQGTSITLPIIVMVLAPMASFIGYVLCGGNLTASIAFSIISVFSALQMALNTLPLCVKAISEGLVSCHRIQNTLLSDDLLPMHNKNNGYDRDALVIKCDLPRDEANESHKKQENIITNGILSNKLENIQQTSTIPVENDNLHIKKGSLVGICGNIGSGKSTLIAQITGEVTIAERAVSVQGSIALVTQQPWIFNATIRDNILFGIPFDNERYKMVVNACCLEMDLKAMPSGDKTEIGENGANLSGGQKQRLNLARAIYSNRDVYLLDDTLSAVDATVGKHIFQNCIKKALYGKTVLIVTHNVQLLEQCDYILLMKEGRISERGTHKELLDLNRNYSQMFFKNNEKRGKKDNVKNDKTKPGKSDQRIESKDGLEIDGTMIKDEVDNANEITWKTWNYFAKCCGGYLISALPFLGMLLFCIANVANVVWLQIWLDAGGGHNITVKHANKTVSESPNMSQNPSLDMYVTVYGACGIILIITGIIKSIIFVKVFFKGAVRLHSTMFSKVIKCPMSFFHKTPLGRIIGRFTRDIDEIEGRIPIMAEFVMQTYFTILIRCGLVCFLDPYFIIIIGIFIVIMILINVYLIGAIGEMKRMENLLRPPILAHITTTIQGLAEIRCYKKQHMFIEKFQKLVNEHLSGYLFFVLSLNWITVKVDVLSWLTITITIIIVLLSKGSTTDGMAGLALSQMYQVCSILSIITRMKTEVSARLISIVRVTEYCENLLKDVPEVIEKNRPTNEWPSKGAITFRNVKLQYDPKLPFVLQDLSVNIRGGEKVGIIGRTGSGKSSVIGALMRFTEICDGSIMIDGVNISEIGLNDLRSKIAVVPQDPVLFQGTIRWNLDPYEHSTDEELWEALDKAHLKKKIMKEPNQLETVLNPNGGTYSIGEKQLFCFARALLKRNKILILDEATASVDVETEILIQETIQKSITNCTLLTIAHRLKTIADYDKIMALEDGKVIEFDSPQHLLQKDSLFRSMMESLSDNSDDVYL